MRTEFRLLLLLTTVVALVQTDHADWEKLRNRIRRMDYCKLPASHASEGVWKRRMFSLPGRQSNRAARLASIRQWKIRGQLKAKVRRTGDVWVGYL
jgi:hypothetical protein